MREPCSNATAQLLLNYGPVGGYGPLREWLAERHGVEASAILLTNGSLQGLDLLVGRYARERRVLVEAPTYDRALAIAARHGAEIRSVPHDAEGLDPDGLERELRRDPGPAFLYVLPTFQNPTGRTLSAERRRRLLELVEEHDLIVLEDDPYRAVRFEGDDVAVPSRVGGRWSHPVLVVLLEDRRTRPPCRISRPAGRRSARSSRRRR